MCLASVNANMSSSKQHFLRSNKYFHGHNFSDGFLNDAFESWENVNGMKCNKDNAKSQ